MSLAPYRAPAPVHYLPNAGAAPFPKPGPGRNPKSVTSLRAWRFQRELQKSMDAAMTQFEDDFDARRRAMLIARIPRTVGTPESPIEQRIFASVRALVVAMLHDPEFDSTDTEPSA